MRRSSSLTRSTERIAVRSGMRAHRLDRAGCERRSRAVPRSAPRGTSAAGSSANVSAGSSGVRRMPARRSARPFPVMSMTRPSSVWQSALTVKSRRMMSSSSVPGRTSGCATRGRTAPPGRAPPRPQSPGRGSARCRIARSAPGGCQPNPAATAASSGIGSMPTVTRSMSLLGGPPSKRSRTKPPTR